MCPPRFTDLCGGHAAAMTEVRGPVRVAWPGINYRCGVCDETLWWQRHSGEWRHWDAGRDLDHAASPGRWCAHGSEGAVHLF